MYLLFLLKGGLLITNSKTTKAIPFNLYPKFYEYIEFEDVLLSNIYYNFI
jgi:hypothetical protein